MGGKHGEGTAEKGLLASTDRTTTKSAPVRKTGLKRKPRVKPQRNTTPSGTVPSHPQKPPVDTSKSDSNQLQLKDMKAAVWVRRGPPVPPETPAPATPVFEVAVKREETPLRSQSTFDAVSGVLNRLPTEEFSPHPPTPSLPKPTEPRPKEDAATQKVLDKKSKHATRMRFYRSLESQHLRSS